MKCLSIRQYWAWAIIERLKRVENRTWGTAHRGPLAIHAGQSIDPDSREALEQAGFSIPQSLATGVVLGTVDLVDVVPWRPGQPSLAGFRDDYGLAEDPLATGPFCWILENPVRFQEPIPLRGRLRLFDADL